MSTHTACITKRPLLLQDQDRHNSGETTFVDGMNFINLYSFAFMSKSVGEV
jgi:hypothetical protein